MSCRCSSCGAASSAAVLQCCTLYHVCPCLVGVAAVGLSPAVEWCTCMRLCQLDACSSCETTLLSGPQHMHKRFGVDPGACLVGMLASGAGRAGAKGGAAVLLALQCCSSTCAAHLCPDGDVVVVVGGVIAARLHLHMLRHAWRQLAHALVGHKLQQSGTAWHLELLVTM